MGRKGAIIAGSTHVLATVKAGPRVEARAWASGTLPTNRTDFEGRGLNKNMRTQQEDLRAKPTGTQHPADAAVFPRTQAHRARTLIDVVWETIATYAEAPAIDDGTALLTYGALGSRMKALAERLWTLGIGAGDRVGVRAPSGSSDLYIAIFGIMACGAAYVPVDIDESNERAETTWSEAGVCAMIGAHLEITLLPVRRAQGHRREPHPEDDSWIIFTSGSTGKPKGVAVTHRSAATWADAEAEMFCRGNPLGPWRQSPCRVVGGLRRIL